MNKSVLIVDDDPVQRRLLEAMITKLGHKCITAEGGTQALDIMQRDGDDALSVVFLDLVMPEMDGIDVLIAMEERGIHVNTIVQTAQGGIDTAVKAMRAGAFDFVVKPVSPDKVKAVITQVLKVGQKETKRKKAPAARSGSFSFKDVISASPRMERVIQVGKKSAGSNIPVLIEGESGVGKEMIARAIQGESARSGKSFVTVNCGALPENLVESILFGHEKGAFTGAGEKHSGKFQEANGGTLFLDEVGELPLDVQVKLLRAIQEGEIDPVGARKAVKVDIRIVSATNKNLFEEVKKGNFREDLFYRLNVFPLAVPPLRKRREDIAKLALHFTKKIAVEEGRSDIVGIERSAMALLESYDWPGNIRQLENAIFRAVVLCESSQLTVDEFPQIQAHICENGTEIPAVRVETDYSTLPVTNAAPPLDDSVHDHLRIDEPVASSKLDGYLDDTGEILPLVQIEKQAIELAIKMHDGQMSKIARNLGIGRSTLYRKLREFGLEDVGN